jgi:hypothetical protein
MKLQSSYYKILVVMGMQWLGFNVGKVGRTKFVVTVKVNYRVFCIFMRHTATIHYL